MYIPQQLKLNKFQHVSIPNPHTILSRLGLHESGTQQYSEEDIPLYMNKDEMNDYALAHILDPEEPVKTNV